VQDVEQVACAARQPVEPCDEKNVTLVEPLDDLGENRTIRLRTVSL
jgi:hypothetical protein